MAPLARSAFEQEIRLDAVVCNGHLVANDLVSTRMAGLKDALIKAPLATLPQTLTRIFPLCGTAHAVAGLQAIEAALQITVSPDQNTFRNLLVLAEHGAALGWRLTMDWPPLLGEPVNTTACAQIRRAVAALSAAAEGDRWTRIGGVRLRFDRDELAGAVGHLTHKLAELFPEAADPALSWEKLQDALQLGASIPARLINAARADTLADYGRHDRRLLPSRDANWFLVRLAADAEFSETPSFDGVPAEVGPLAARRHPLIAEAVAHWGSTLATRLLAAALDVFVVVERLRNAANQTADDEPAEVDLTRSGRGAGVVETARGPLAYLIETDDGHARMLKSVAPTEWNFHPDGPFVAALRSAPPVPDPVHAARLLAASFDPCVPFSIALPDDSPRLVPGESPHA